MRYLLLIPAITLATLSVIMAFIALWSPPEGEEQSMGMRVVVFALAVCLMLGALATANLIDQGVS